MCDGGAHSYCRVVVGHVGAMPGARPVSKNWRELSRCHCFFTMQACLSARACAGNARRLPLARLTKAECEAVTLVATHQAPPMFAARLPRRLCVLCRPRDRERGVVVCSLSAIGMCLAFALPSDCSARRFETSRARRRNAGKRRHLAYNEQMLNTKPHVLTRAIDGDVTTLVFYPDTGCLRFADSRGVVCHELRPPHSWFAIASASREVRGGTHAMSEGLSTLLHEFCAKRSRWLSGPAAARMLASTRAHALSPALCHERRAARTPAFSSSDADVHTPLRSLTMNVAAAQ